MNETEWLTITDDSLRQLVRIHEFASLRKLRLITAAVVRPLQTLPPDSHCWEQKACDDLIEAASDHPRPWPELEAELATSPGYWGFTHVLAADSVDQAAKDLRKLIILYPPRALWREFASLIHDVMGNPFRPITLDPVWRTSTVLTLADGIYADRAFDRLPILADALQDAGCENADVLEHCRGPGPHVRGCWVVDLVLGKS